MSYLEAVNDPVTMMVSDQAMPGSTDVGDVSWVAPTAQISVACQKGA